MSFRSRLVLRIAVLVVLSGALGLAALFGLMGMRRHFEASADGYAQLRSVYEIGHRAALARALSRTHPRDIEAIRASLTLARQEALRIGEWREPVLQRIAAAEATLTQRSADTSDLDLLLADVARFAGELKGEIIATRQAAARHLGYTITVLAIAFTGILLCAIWIGYSIYKGVMRPIRTLRAGVDAAAQGDLGHRLEESGDAEFRHLAMRFNRMTRELDSLTQSLEHEVEQKSRQLLRSEQLAGVGVLAAGVAHEINNPLSIIAGYAESCLQHLGELNGEAAAHNDVRETLEIILDEAFRCRDITTRLLDLARKDDEAPAQVDMVQLSRRVVGLLGALPQWRNRSICIDTATSAIVMGHEGQLTQVLMNLVTNALEAGSDESGEVKISLSSGSNMVCIQVQDFGRGMNETARHNAFEPFWTDKPDRNQSGTGLGLAVTHAIIEQHGGQIRACSEGAERGTTLTIELPAAAGVASGVEL